MDDEDLIMCITCGDYADPNAPHTGNWDDYGHSDAAHYPSWYPHPPVKDNDES